jgi:hypothetical protein
MIPLQVQGEDINLHLMLTTAKNKLMISRKEGGLQLLDFKRQEILVSTAIIP